MRINKLRIKKSKPNHFRFFIKDEIVVSVVAFPFSKCLAFIDFKNWQQTIDLSYDFREKCPLTRVCAEREGGY